MPCQVAKQESRISLSVIYPTKNYATGNKTLCIWTDTGVEINTGPVARGQWICCRASEICYPLAWLACKILKPNFWDYMV